MADYGAPYTLRPERLPDEVYKYLVDATHTNKFYAHLVSSRFDLSSDECKAVSHFGVDIAKEFPFMQGVILEDLQFTMKGADEEDPQFPWMFVKFLHPVQGSFYFLFQNLLPSHFTMHPDDPIAPMYPKEEAAKVVKPGTTIALAKVVPSICCNCCKATGNLHCSECRNHGLRFYYCSKECQIQHWKVHKAVCAKGRAVPAIPETIT